MPLETRIRDLRTIGLVTRSLLSFSCVRNSRREQKTASACLRLETVDFETTFRVERLLISSRTTTTRFRRHGLYDTCTNDDTLTVFGYGNVDSQSQCASRSKIKELQKRFDVLDLLNSIRPRDDGVRPEIATRRNSSRETIRGVRDITKPTENVLFSVRFGFLFFTRFVKQCRRCKTWPEKYNIDNEIHDGTRHSRAFAERRLLKRARIDGFLKYTHKKRKKNKLYLLSK